MTNAEFHLLLHCTIVVELSDAPGFHFAHLSYWFREMMCLYDEPFAVAMQRGNDIRI